MEEAKAKLNFLKRWKEDIQNAIQHKYQEVEKVEIELVEVHTKLEVYKEIPSEHEGIIRKLEEEISVLEEKREQIFSQIEEQKDVSKSIDNKIKQVEISQRY